MGKTLCEDVRVRVIAAAEGGMSLNAAAATSRSERASAPRPQVVSSSAPTRLRPATARS